MSSDTSSGSTSTSASRSGSGSTHGRERFGLERCRNDLGHDVLVVGILIVGERIDVDIFGRIDIVDLVVHVGDRVDLEVVGVEVGVVDVGRRICFDSSIDLIDSSVIVGVVDVIGVVDVGRFRFDRSHRRRRIGILECLEVGDVEFEVRLLDCFVEGGLERLVGEQLVERVDVTVEVRSRSVLLTVLSVGAWFHAISSLAQSLQNAHHDG